MLEQLKHSVPAITRIDGPLEGTPVLEPLEHSVLEKSSHDEPMEEAPVVETVRAFGSENASGRWITGGKISLGLVCTTRHGTVRVFGSGRQLQYGSRWNIRIVL